MDFPATFTFRVIAVASPELCPRCAELVAVSLGREILGVESRPSANGRYLAIHVTADVQSADEVRAAFRVLSEVEGVRMLL
jgi:putative lipoic acid-binding regulatory protein